MDLHIKGLRHSVQAWNCGTEQLPWKQKRALWVPSHLFLDKSLCWSNDQCYDGSSHAADGRRRSRMLQKEPHVVDVANFLNSMGANIRGAGTDVIRIVGVESLHKTDYSVIPDQIEAGTFMFAAAATHGDILVKM